MLANMHSSVSPLQKLTFLQLSDHSLDSQMKVHESAQYYVRFEVQKRAAFYDLFCKVFIRLVMDRESHYSQSNLRRSNHCVVSLKLIQHPVSTILKKHPQKRINTTK